MSLSPFFSPTGYPGNVFEGIRYPASQQPHYTNWLDPKTVSKFVVLGADYKETLLKYVDASELPEKYGGTCTLKLPEVNFDLVPKERPETFRLDTLGLDAEALEGEEETL